MSEIAKIEPINFDTDQPGETLPTTPFDALTKFVKDHAIAFLGKTPVEIPVSWLQRYHPELQKTLVKDPDRVISRLIKELTAVSGSQIDAEAAIQNINFIGFDTKTTIRRIGQKNARQMIAVEGVIRSISEVRAIITVGFFLCNSCECYVEEPQPDPYSIKTPRRCSGLNGDKPCREKRFAIKDLDLDLSTKVDGEYGVLQEFPEGLKSGEQPQSIDLIIKGPLVRRLAPGRRVTLNGIVREKLLKKDAPTVGYFLDVHSIETAADDYDEIEITADDEALFNDWAAQENILERVFKSIAPSIYGNETVKQAIAYQLFGGVSFIRDKIHQRGDIHILLIGDPGVAKSQIIRQATSISPRGIFANGKSSTSAGLTATVRREKETEKYVLEAGALVLADGGICAVDEIDKMDAEHRSAFHEAMESQTISINKAGINQTLQTRCAVIAAANPINGCWDDMLDLKSQINIEATILSRFDLIFLLRDRANEVADANLAKHILNTTARAQLEALGESFLPDTEDEIDHDLLRKFIAFCRKRYFPILSNDANTQIEEYFVKIRQQAGPNKPVPITARNINSIIRLCQARARIQLHNEVSVDDAIAVIKLVEDCLRGVALDKHTGLLDASILETGRALTKTQMMNEICKTIALYQEEGRGTHIQMLYAHFKNYPRDEFDRLLETLNREGRIIKPRENYYKACS